MRRTRLVGFLIAIVLGIAGGLVLGWRYYPAKVGTTGLADLRNDYKADVVLMVAESYATDGNLAKAMKSLESINPGNPLRAAQQGLLTAQQMGYADWEMRYLIDLEQDVMTESLPTAATGTSK